MKPTPMLKAIILLLALPLLANAEIYRWQDDAGFTHFSDHPHDNATIIDVGQTPRFYTVSKVYDGDTVTLEDDRKIRLLGINTPEIQRRGQLAEAGGIEARDWLREKILGKKVRLELGSEQTDAYGRTLAHLFTEDDEHINLQLVEQGLATVSIYPPNLRYDTQLVAAEDAAEKAELGIWQHSDYSVLPVENLTDAGSAGWTRLKGKVIALKTTSKSIYLEFTPLLRARIEREWQHLFLDPNHYLNKTVELRGWLTRQDKGFVMLLRHPSAIKLK